MPTKLVPLTRPPHTTTTVLDLAATTTVTTAAAVVGVETMAIKHQVHVNAMLCLKTTQGNV